LFYQLVDLSAAQDVEAGDGTTSVVVLAGSLDRIAIFIDLAPIAVAAVTRLVTRQSSNVDLRDIRVVKKVGGTIEDTELIDGVVLNQNVVVAAGGPTRMEKAKIAIIQFQLSAPKPDVSRLDYLPVTLCLTSLQMDNTVVINDYRQMDKVIKEGRQYLLNICKKIKKANCNVLLDSKIYPP
jgi:T-complex protein 1 subunit delta